MIPNATNPYNYKLVCYDGDSSAPLVTAVYKLENYDYNIHDKQFKLTTLLEILKRSDNNEKHARSILENNRSVYGTIFKKYSTKSRRFNDLARKHNRNLQDVGIKSNRAGVNQEFGQEFSSGVKGKFSLDEDYDFSDPSKLDEEKLKIYNNRGWSYGLFNKEDMALLSEKVQELKKGTQKSENALWDGSRLVEVNNKLIILGGTFKNPKIYSVLAINANNETEAEFIKEYIYNEFDNFRRNKETLSSLFIFEENYDGKELIRTYLADDFKYYKGRNSGWTRATLPSNFKDYGYSKGRNERYGSSFRTGKSVSSVQLNEENKYTDKLILFADKNIKAETDLHIMTSSLLSEFLVSKSVSFNINS